MFPETKMCLTALENSTIDLLNESISLLDLCGIGSFKYYRRQNQIWLNNELRRIFELSENEPLFFTMNEYFDTFVHPKDRERLMKEANERVAKGIIEATFHYRVITWKGNIKNVVVKSFIMEEVNIGLIGVVKEVK